MVQSQEPAETRPRSNKFLSRELVFQGTISEAKHRQNIFMAGTEYFGETAQLREHIPEFYLSTPCGNHTAQSHTLAALITGAPSSLHERGRDSCLRAVLCYKRLFTKACMGCKRFF